MERPVRQHQHLNPPELLPASGFSHITVAAPGRHVFVAGQTAHQQDGTVRGETMAAQADAALANLAVALRTAQAQPADLVEMQIFVTDVDAYRSALQAIGDAWRRHLGNHYPAISLFGVAALFDPAALIEITARAVVTD